MSSTEVRERAPTFVEAQTYLRQQRDAALDLIAGLIDEKTYGSIKSMPAALQIQAIEDVFKSSVHQIERQRDKLHLEDTEATKSERAGLYNKYGFAWSIDIASKFLRIAATPGATAQNYYFVSDDLVHGATVPYIDQHLQHIGTLVHDQYPEFARVCGGLVTKSIVEFTVPVRDSAITTSSQHITYTVSPATS